MGLPPLTRKDRRIAARNGRRLIEAARNGDQALQAEVDRLYPKGAPKAQAKEALTQTTK